MERFLNALRAQSGTQDATIGQPRFATISSVDPQTGNVRVQLQPENVLSGWLPVLSSWIGNGWGISCPPSSGDQVMIVPVEGDAENGVVIGRAWTQNNAAPQTPVGELWLTHRSGSFLKLLNDGTIAVKGDLHVEGNVFDRHGSIDQLRTHYNAHKHTVPQGGLTSTPKPED